ncbi:NAD(P)-binding protein, partial [Rhizopogon salebrosus TDB-379]
ANSVVGKIGAPGAAAYCASNFAIRGLTQSAAIELGKYDITVNSYASGWVMTPMAKGVTDRFGNIFLDEIDTESKGYIAACVQKRPLKQEGQADDVASIVSYLASNEAHFITGQCISVDGGIVV